MSSRSQSSTPEALHGSPVKILSLLEYLSRIFPTCFSKNATKNQKLFSFLTHAVLAASVLTMVNTYVRGLGAMALRSCSFGVILSEQDSQLHGALKTWISENVKLKTNPSLWTARCMGRFDGRRRNRKSRPNVSEHDIEATEKSSFWFLHRGGLFRYKISIPADRWRRPRENVTLRHIGFSKKPILDLLPEASKYYAENHTNETTCIRVIKEGEWRLLANRKAQRLDTVDLHEAVK